MAILGTGIDIVENYRVKKILFKKKSNFKKKIFTINEIAYCEKKTNSTGCYSKRFAAKEAFVKALGIGFRENINFKDIEISNDNYGKPSILLKGKVADYLKKKIKNRKYYIYLSLSDDVPWAQATVIISYNK